MSTPLTFIGLLWDEESQFPGLGILLDGSSDGLHEPLRGTNHSRELRVQPGYGEGEGEGEGEG